MSETLGTIRGQIRLDVKQAVAAYAALRAQNQRTVYAMRGTGDAFIATGQTLGIAGAGMIYGFAKVVGAAAEFERKMDFFGAVSAATADDMDRVGKHAMDLAETTIYSADQIADGFVELGKAGVTAEAIIDGIGQAMVNLGAAGDIPLEQSGQIITSTIQQFALDANQAVKVTDLLAGAANASIADISDIGVSLKYVGGVASAVGLSFEDTTTAISLLAKAGIRGSTAGTSLRQMIVSLGGATGPARESLKELGILTEDGSNKFFTAEGKAKSLSQVFQILQDSTADLTQKQRLMHLRTIFNNRALSAASILTRSGAKGFKQMNKEMSKVSAAEVAAERLNNLSGDIEVLRSNISTMMIRAGGPFQETLRGWVQMITKVVQAFDDLDPSTQKFIIQSVAISGVVLVAMAAISVFIGVIFRFVAAALNMAAGVKFVARMIRILWTNGRWAMVLFKGPFVAALAAVAGALGLTVGAFVAIIAVIAAAVIGLVVLYKKWEPFRKVVDTVAAALWSGIKAIGAFFKALVTDPGKAWDMLKSGMSQLGGWIKDLGGDIWSGLQGVGDRIGAFVDSVVDWFTQLPGRVGSVISDFTAKVADLFTFENVGYALGFLIGTVVGFFVRMGLSVIGHVTSMVSSVVGFFQSLPARVGYLVGFLVGKVVGYFIRMGLQAVARVRAMYTGVMGFFRALPGRVATFIANMVTRAILWFQKMRTQAPILAARMVAGVINWIQQLPGRVATFVANMADRARSAFTRMKTNAVNMATGLYNGVINGIAGLPGAVTGIFNNVVGAIKGVITSAFNAVRDFASGMWEGFKDGLDINSPSIIEKQMYQMTDVIDSETKKIGRKTMQIQGIAKKISQTKFGFDTDLPSAKSYARLASMRNDNLNRARTLAGRVEKQKASDQSRANRPARPGKQKLTITNWHTGEGYMSDIADDTQQENNYYDETFERMG